MADEPALDEARLLEVGRLLGLPTLRKAVAGLGDMARTAFATPGAERGEAHALASQAELVGFMAFGTACRSVEVAARAGLPLDGAVEAARAAREEALGGIEAFLSQEADIMAAATAASDRLRTPSALNRAAR